MQKRPIKIRHPMGFEGEKAYTQLCCSVVRSKVNIIALYATGGLQLLRYVVQGGEDS